MTPKAQTGSDKQDHDVHTCLQNSVDLYEILNIGAGTQEGVPSRFTSCEPVFVGPGPTHNCLDPLLQSQENVTIQKDPYDSKGYIHRKQATSNKERGKPDSDLGSQALT